MARKQQGSEPEQGIGLLGTTAGTVLAALAGGIAYSAFVVPHDLPLPHAVSGERRGLNGRAGELSYYVAGEGKPLLLVHSINAAASAYEMRPLYEHYRATRRVYTPDLPGFGFSERGDRNYTPRLYTDAVLEIVEEILRETGAEAIDALALSLSSEFLARAASEQPAHFHTVALISPTAFRKGDRYYGEPGSVRGTQAVANVLKNPLWGQVLFDALNSRRSERYFFERTFGSKQIDEGLLEYSYLSTHQPGARFAPFAFLSASLFSADIDRVYDRLEMPVWLSHGVRGDFQNYSSVNKVTNRPNWNVTTFQTGALPHFERLDEFVQRYDSFLLTATKL